MTLTRRHTLAAALAAAIPHAAFAQGAKLKVAAIYTVPVEQQWVSRLDKALLVIDVQKKLAALLGTPIDSTALS